MKGGESDREYPTSITQIFVIASGAKQSYEKFFVQSPCKIASSGFTLLAMTNYVLGFRYSQMIFKHFTA